MATDCVSIYWLTGAQRYYKNGVLLTWIYISPYIFESRLDLSHNNSEKQYVDTKSDTLKNIYIESISWIENKNTMYLLGHIQWVGVSHMPLLTEIFTFDFFEVTLPVFGMNFIECWI